MKEIIEASFLRENFEKFTRKARLSRGGARFTHEAYAWKELATLLNCLPESDYDKGMREAMRKIAKSCGKAFTVDIGYENLPDLIDELINNKNQSDKEIAAMEKQPEYEYTKVTESIFDLKDEFESLSLCWANDCGAAIEYIKVYKNDFSMLAKQYENKNLYRRVEITPEQKREREIEELALRLAKMKCECELGNISGDPFSVMAKDAIEWMESKK